MTRPLQIHLSLDEIDALLADTAGAPTLEHLHVCSVCSEQVEAERDLVTQLGTLASLAPSQDFADRAMARIVLGAPAPARVPARLARPARLAAAASIMLVLGAAMAASIIWSLGNREALAAAGSWLGSEAVDWLWLGVQGVASNLIEQPWYDRARGLLGAPARIAALSAAASLLYIGGVLALRRLMALPAPGAAHAHA